MARTTIDPPTQYRVIVAGGRVAAAQAVAKYIDIHRPMGKATVDGVNGYDAVHTRVWADRDQMEAWFADSHARVNGLPVPGALLFYATVES